MGCSGHSPAACLLDTSAMTNALELNGLRGLKDQLAAQPPCADRVNTPTAAARPQSSRRGAASRCRPAPPTSTQTGWTTGGCGCSTSASSCSPGSFSAGGSTQGSRGGWRGGGRQGRGGGGAYGTHSTASGSGMLLQAAVCLCYHWSLRRYATCWRVLMLWGLWLRCGCRTYVHVGHGLITYYLLHWTKGSPIQSDQGKWDRCATAFLNMQEAGQAGAELPCLRGQAPAGALPAQAVRPALLCPALSLLPPFNLPLHLVPRPFSPLTSALPQHDLLGAD